MILPSHWPVFWFRLKPGLHWHTEFACVWLQIASSPHGFVFFPHTSPLESTNKGRTLNTRPVLGTLNTRCAFLLWCAEAKRASPPSQATHLKHGHAYITINDKTAGLKSGGSRAHHRNTRYFSCPLIFCLNTTGAALTGLAVLLVGAAVAAVAEQVALQLHRDAAPVTAGELRLPTGPRSAGRHLCSKKQGRLQRQLCTISFWDLILLNKSFLPEYSKEESGAGTTEREKGRGTQWWRGRWREQWD